MNRYTLLFSFFSLLCLVLFVADLMCGAIHIPFSETIDILLNGKTNSVESTIIRTIRLPKAITAIIAGISLSLAGLMMQTLFRNPLAGPYILGISSGATLGVATIIMSGTLLGFSTTNGWLTIMAAIFGAFIVLLLVLAVSFRVKNAVSLLIVGMMFGSVAGALVNILQNYSNPDALKLFIVWTFGSLSSISWVQMQVLLPIFLLGTLLTFMLIKPLNGLLLGENYARGLGIPIQQTRLLIIIATGLLAGGITAFTGPIAFVGVAIPHIARGLFRTSNHQIVMPASAILGAILLLLCDIISQTTAHPLPISTVSALFGAPIIIWIIMKRK